VSTPEDLDDLPYGTTYQRVKSASLTAAGLVILDQVVVGTNVLGKSTDISAGHIKLDTVVEGTYGLVKSTDITSGHIKLSTAYGDLDDIDNGSTYSKLRTTDIDSGHIKLSSYTKVSGEWYDEAGVEIDAAHGINIYGTNNALTTRATKTGTIQCYVGSDGAIYAGGGDVKLDANGIIIYGEKLRFYYGATYTGYLKPTPTAMQLWSTSARDLEIHAGNSLRLIADDVVYISGDYLYLGTNCPYMVLPMKTSAQGSPPDGCIIFNPDTGYTNVYSSHDGAWHHFNRDAGWA